MTYIYAETIDDLLRETFGKIQSHGDLISPSRGTASEILGVVLELSNPRARLSRTETRGKPFSCLGEFCWYLAGSDRLAFIEYYLPAYGHSADKGIVAGAYGPRLMGNDGHGQLRQVVDLLKDRKDSRRAVVQIFGAEDIQRQVSDVPCTCVFQFFLRRQQLHMVTYMRSNDAYIGLPHDIFCFTMIQELVARSLSAELGTYKHHVGSLHLYSNNHAAVEAFLNEGYQSTTLVMPEMPEGDPWASLDFLLEAEAANRIGSPGQYREKESVAPYWMDLARILEVLRYCRDGNGAAAEAAREGMSCDAYNIFLDQRLLINAHAGGKSG